jgi:hypothetical protein
MANEKVSGYKQASDGEIKLSALLGGRPVDVTDTQSGFYTLTLNRLTLEQAEKVAAFLKAGL